MNEWIVALYFGIIIFLTFQGYRRQQREQKGRQGSDADAKNLYFFAQGKVSDFAISMSLFATIFSSITFLGVPGEVVTYGLAFLATIPAYLLAVFLINRYVVEKLFHLNVDHLYQVVGRKYGLLAQRMAVIYYLMLRISWMAILIYMSGKSICVVYGIDTSHALPVAMGLAGFAIVYCTLGGLVTVIKTDSLQGIAMFLAVSLLVGFVFYLLGPEAFVSSLDFSHWPEHPVISLDPNSKMSILGRAWMSLIWLTSLYIGDQVSFQRIRSSSSLSNAKKALRKKAVLSSLLVVILTLVAFSLMSFYGANPQLIPTENWFATSGDAVLPHFISLNLMPGLAGIVLVGLLSASMSSVDSVINGFTAILSDGETCPPLAKVSRIPLSFGIGAFVLVWVAVIPYLRGSILEIAGRLTVQLHIFVAAFLFVSFYWPHIRKSSVIIGIPVATCLALMVTYSQEIFSLRQPLVGYEWTSVFGVLISLGTLLTVDQLTRALERMGWIETNPENLLKNP